MEKQELDEITPLRKIERLSSFLRAQTLGPLGRLLGYRRATEETLQMFSAGTYDCTLCGRCAVVCPVNIDTRALWIAMRETLVDQAVYPDTFDHLVQTVTNHHNISGDVNENRLIWSENLPEVPEGVAGGGQAETVYFVGCVASFYPRTYSVPQSMVEILEQAKVDFMTLGGEEWCCGFPLIIAGMGDVAFDAMRHNLEAVRRTGAKRLVAACPSCYHTWKHDYPRVLNEPLGFEVLHATEALEEIIDAGLIELKPFKRSVTYHDPCDLGRSSGVYEAPRDVIRAIPEITFTEMEHYGEYSLCCGGGGDVEMADKDLTAAVAQRRVEEAAATEAQVILSACQQCERTLAEGARKARIRVRAMDIAELIAKQMVR
jgi:Fe-S oxidoreductase